jgi:hypothetical protein
LVHGILVSYVEQGSQNRFYRTGTGLSGQLWRKQVLPVRPVAKSTGFLTLTEPKESALRLTGQPMTYQAARCEFVLPWLQQGRELVTYICEDT